MDVQQWVEENIEDSRVADAFLNLYDDTFVHQDETVTKIEYRETHSGVHNFDLTFEYNDGLPGGRIEMQIDNVVFDIREENFDA